MNSNEIRSAFLNFFKKNKHEIINSSSLVPENDPTLMFANSGMVQFKNIFTGKEKRNYKRASTSQKCVRAGGKHNDLENVGYTSRHHTFFEMLGNFSFGDYFKEQAIEFAWNLITKEFNIDKKRLIVTVFSEDDESYLFWKKISGLSNDKIIKINTSDNFWSMGDTGPCGPCSEIFFDHGENFNGGPPGSPNEDGDRFIEIWNLVFMQYEQISKTERIDLPKPSIDTGMGLERISALLQNSNDNYSTDLFLPLINKSIELSNNDSISSKSSHRVISDHLRSASFLIADGVMPSNEGRGYVLRRIMRRGMRHAHSLGNKDSVFHKIFPTLLENMKESFPELERAKDLIKNTLFNEEEKFKETIEKGIKILEEEIKISNHILNGEVAFKLYDTYGFPLDLTQDYLKNKNIQVDVDSFNKKMKEQKKLARQSWKGTGDIEENKIWSEVTEQIQSTEFLGYKKSESQSIILSLISDNKSVDKLNKGEDGVIILNQTPFYAESGGQVGDNGYLKNENFEFNVKNTTKIFQNYHLHWGQVIKGSCNKGDILEAYINYNRRNLIKCNHSSTHLLHSALRKVLGNHVFQKGSLVNDKKLRFDFSHNETIEIENLLKIDELVNQQISYDSKVEINIIDHKKAIDEGAIALFGEKYNDEVRVVSMGKVNNLFFSKELCGGTHVNKTGEIKKFRIIGQSSVASGIKRIEAISNITVDNYIKTKENFILEKEKKHQLDLQKFLLAIKKIDQNKIVTLDSNKNLETQLKDIKKLYAEMIVSKNLKENMQNISVENINNINFVYLMAKNYPSHSLKQFIDDQKNKYKNNCVAIIISNNKGKLSIVIGTTSDLISKFDSNLVIKDISTVLGGKGGGGRKDLAQAGGNDPNKVMEAIDLLRFKIKNLF